MREGLRIYNLFPNRAGTIRQWIAHLPRIAAMGFEAVYVNPFHYPRCSKRPKAAVLDLVEAGFDHLFNSIMCPWRPERYEAFRRIAPSIGFPESHDVQRLVVELPAGGVQEAEIAPRFRQAYVLAATHSTGVMPLMGFEYAWSRRLDVVVGDDAEEPEFGLSEDAEFVLEEAFIGEVIAGRGTRRHLCLDPAKNPAMLFRLLPARNP